MAGDRDIVDATDFGRELEKTFQKMRSLVRDYDYKDRRRITRKAAQKVAQSARKILRPMDSDKPHFRAAGRLKYSPGNLRRSVKVLAFKGTYDAFVGPKYANAKDLPSIGERKNYGGVGEPVDGYYAAMAFGSALEFRKRVLEPALQSGKSEALKILRQESEKAIIARGIRRGLIIKK